MSSTISSIDNDVVHLLNAPKCAFKVPTTFPPVLNLNQQQQQGNTRLLFNVRNKISFTTLINNNNNNNDNSLLSTSSESDNDEHMPISILSILEKLV